ncbi:MAG: ArsC family reductase [Halioglobus sp.]|nr:ArsC family reductase [Halioglobus sp.]
MIVVYGINNCDTVRKARRWLDAHEVEYRFHDLREDGISRAQVEAWLDELGWQALVNRRSSSWKALSEQARQAMDDAAAADAIIAQPTLIKRPLLDLGHERHSGFSAGRYSDIFSKHTL